MGFETLTTMLNSSKEMWANVANYDMPRLGTGGGFSDIFDLGSLQAAGNLGTKWLSDESLVESFLPDK
ncbi:hypothetical protein M5689_015685 [Euphorbia peplus]|nr:hypothetical protein M5689_015685 [Euphorbia peplus]